jgi:hypothetical protein
MLKSDTFYKLANGILDKNWNLRYFVLDGKILIIALNVLLF